ncbi:cysteine hydrolase family protein [Acidovorax sp. LjRoot117]|uniref:cysteine hydrolase family protein n=1 Tax=Acidovorax sp. LjRoot117 TaxID=3342255 RepID=UPI003F505392
MLVVDFINPLQFPGAENLLKAALQAAYTTSKLKQRLKESGATVIYANDNYGIWRSEFRDLLQACKALPGARGEIAKMLAPSGDDLTILKPLHSAFHGTPLEHLLKEI